MSREERVNRRNIAFSKWHRSLPGDLDMIDIDNVEYCHSCKEPLAVLETAFDTGRYKAATVTTNLARRLGVRGYRILHFGNPDADEIAEPITIQMLWPNQSNETRCHTLAQLEKLIRWIHEECPYCGYQNPASTHDEVAAKRKRKEEAWKEVLRLDGAYHLFYSDDDDITITEDEIVDMNGRRVS